MKEFDLVAIQRCIACRGCEKDCPSFLTIEGYDPMKIYNDILAGNIEAWLSSPMIWQCLECHTCSEMCPQSYSWETVFTKLKSMSMKQNLCPKSVTKGFSQFLKTSKLGDSRESYRAKAGLPPSKKTGIEEFKKIAEITK